MKKARAALLITLMLLAPDLCRAESPAGAPQQEKKAGTAGNGLKDMLLGWVEIPRAITRVSRESHNPLWGLTAGTLQGIAAAFPRTVGGAVEVSASGSRSVAPSAGAARD